MSLLYCTIKIIVKLTVHKCLRNKKKKTILFTLTLIKPQLPYSVKNSNNSIDSVLRNYDQLISVLRFRLREARKLE